MLIDQFKTDLNSALKKGDSLKVSVLRLLLSALTYEKINVQKDLADEDVLNVVKKEAKKRRESIELYTQGQRNDLADKEKKELEILLTYLPQEMSEEEIIKMVKEIIAKLNPEEKQNFGMVMGKVMAQLKGKAEGNLISKKVKEILMSS